MDFRILGPLEVCDGEEIVDLGRPQQRALLALLLICAGEVSSRDWLVGELWGDDPPAKAANTLQVYISHLRKILGATVIQTKSHGYAFELGENGFDLSQFERHFANGANLYRNGDALAASEALKDALGLWRGEPLADFVDQPFAQSAIARLEELRLAAVELCIDAELELGRHSVLISRLEQLVRENHTRERPRGQLMLALYRCGRQAEALSTYREARQELVERLGIEPGRPLRELEQAILRQESGLSWSESNPDATISRGGVHGSDGSSSLSRGIVVASESMDGIDSLLGVAEPLSREPPRELIVACLVRDPAVLEETMAALDDRRARLADRGVDARVTTFTSGEAGKDVVRLTSRPGVDLALVEGSSELENGGLSGDVAHVVEHAPCDVGLVWAHGAPQVLNESSAVYVPFGGDESEFIATELAAWVARSHRVPLWLLGKAAGGADGERDASRLLGNVALALQRVAKVVAKPLLVEAGATGVLDAASDAGLLVLGFPDDWQQRGLGVVRAAIARDARPPRACRSQRDAAERAQP